MLVVNIIELDETIYARRKKIDGVVLPILCYSFTLKACF